MTLSVRRGKMPRKAFLEQFSGHEDDANWVETQIKAGHKGLKAFADDIQRAQKRIRQVSAATGLSVMELKISTGACRSVRRKPVAPKKTWSKQTYDW